MLVRICFIIVFAPSLSAIGVTIDPGKKEIPVTHDTTVSELLNAVDILGYNRATFSCGSLGKLDLPKLQSLKLGDLGFPLDGKCIAAPKAKGTAQVSERKDPEADIKAKLLHAAFLDKDDPSEMHRLLTEIGDPHKAFSLLSYAKTGTLDGNKGVLYLAARKGNLKTIQAIRKAVTPDEFITLLRASTDQKQSVLHAAARATKNADQVIRLVVELAPDLVSSKNAAGCTPLEVAIMFSQKEEMRLAALLNLPPASEAFHKHTKTISGTCKPIQNSGM